MSDTAWAFVWVAVGVVLAFASAWLGRRWWLRKARLALVGTFSRKEAVESALRSLTELMGRLADADDAVWTAFACDPESEERRAVGELRHRMEVVAGALATTPLPKAAHETADGIEEVARSVAEAMAGVERGGSPVLTVEAIAAIDIGGMRARFGEAEAELDALLDAFGVEDPSVYGGGLYI